MGDFDELPTNVQRDPSSSGVAAFRLTSSVPAAAVTLTVDRPTPLLIGTSPVCELRLAGGGVSRRHASLTHLGSRLRLDDLQSTNGTTVNGIAIASAYLQGGESIRVGEVELSVARVEVQRGAPATKPSTPLGFGMTLGRSAVMQRLYPLCARLAASDVPIVLEGETGTGKEVLAHSLHLASRRAEGPFVVFDCTAIPQALFEAELFGHERGAFTGATATHRGCLERAHGGTLLVDEIGDLDLALQAKLLRAAETHAVRRVGGERTVTVDVRILSATRRDLDREVQAGRFRDDLFFRLAVARIALPPLRERVGDVGFLAAHFWTDLQGPPPGPPPELLARWESHDWPGNVRELRNMVARAIALGDVPPTVSSGGVPPRATTLEALVEQCVRDQLSFPDARDRVLRAFERTFLEHLSQVHGRDWSKVAETAGIGRRYLNMLRARNEKE